jgi:hypothetical protein
MIKYLFLILSLLFIVSCENPSSNPSVENPENNKFVGKWVELFDATADDKHTKEQKMSYWYKGDLTGWIIPDTMNIQNDSVCDTYAKYWYDSTMIHMTDLIQYESIQYDTNHLFYSFPTDDSMYIYVDPDVFDTGYIPVYIRLE